MKKILPIIITQIALLTLFGCQQQGLNGTTQKPLQLSTTATIKVTPGVNGAQTQVLQPENIMISKKILSWSNKSVTLAQLCNGMVKKAQDNVFGDKSLNINYCLGENMLQLSNNNGPVVQLADQKATNDADAPILLDATIVPGSSTLLVSYGPNPCDTTNDCGAGMPTNYVSLAVNLDTNTPRNILYFPKNGTAVWNTTNSKALFIPQTCGGAGCDTASLIGYDLTQDQLNAQLTKETAAGDEQTLTSKNPSFTDVDGKKLAYWKSVKWTSAKNFQAVLVQADGKEKTISGTF